MQNRPGAPQVLPGKPILAKTDEGPPWLSLQGHELRVDPGSGRDAVCGRLVVPVVVEGRLRDAAVELAPPEDWSVQQVQAMWNSASRLEATRILAAPLLLDGRLAKDYARGIDWQALAAALAQAEALVLRWPNRTRLRKVEGSTATPRGREDESATASAIESGRISALTSPLRLDRAVYNEAIRKPWTSALLTRQIDRLAVSLREALAASDPSALGAISALGDVRSLADPGTRSAGREPPFSSWPHAVARLMWLAQKAERRVSIAGAAGSGTTPTRRLWTLYEDWVTVATLEALEALLGPPVSRALNPLASWESEGKEVALWRQFDFRFSSPRPLLGEAVVGVGHGALRPDIVLAVRSNDRVRVGVLDAKAYRQIGYSGAIDEMTAKYLWGMRRLEGSPPAPTAPLLEFAGVVAPVGAPKSQAPPHLSRTRTIQAVPPPDGPGLPEAVIAELLNELM